MSLKELEAIQKSGCACGKQHVAAIDKILCGAGVLNELPTILAEYGVKKPYILCDRNTYAAAGERVCALLDKAGIPYSIYTYRDERPAPNEHNVGLAIMFLPKDCDIVIGVGSGVINDIGKIVSNVSKKPYIIVGTAPSMDGYASAGSPFLHDGTKTTVQATTPKYIIGDLDILKDAPWEMMLAGIGDMFGKYTGLLDWELARDYSGEYFCQKIAADVLDATNKCLENGYLLTNRDPVCVKNVMEGFLVTGLGMAYTGNSRPASGSEHIVAHAWELFDVENGRPPHLHGLEVCEATRLIAIMYKMLLEETDDAHLKELIGRYIPYFDAVEEFCIKMKVPPTVTDREEIISGIHRALVMRDRYTILFYLRDIGKLEEYAAAATDRLLAVL